MIPLSQYHIGENTIEFIYYNLKHSSIHQKPTITIDQINLISLKTYPHSFVINGNEVIFLNHDDDNSLEFFAKRNEIPVCNRDDLWSYLNSPYLDTEFDEQSIKQQHDLLMKYGLNQAAIKKIRRKIKWTLWGTMEWSYLGLWDLLAYKKCRNPLYRFFGNKFYWWSMKIALTPLVFCESRPEDMSSSRS